jgi:O-antigen/teichoic acid export membrane protein
VLLKAAAFKSGILLLSAFVAVNTQSMHTIVYGYAAAVTVSIVLILGSILAPLRQELNIKRLELNRNQFWLVATFAAPLFVNSILTNSGIWFTGRSVLTKLNGTQMYAEIALGLQWYGLAALASGVIARVVVPIVTRSAFQDDKSTAKSSIQLGLFMSTGSAAFVFCIVLLFSEQILALYGSELQGAKAVLLMFVGAAVMSSCIEVVSSALVGRGLQLIVTYIIVSWWISLLGLLFLLSKYGSIGVSIAFLASYMVYFICGVIAGQKYSVLSEFS